MLISLLILSQTLAFGAPERSAPDLPVDDLRESVLATKRSKPAARIIKAMAALRSGKTSEARKASASLKGDALFQDYALYLAASADRIDAEKKLIAKKWAEAGTLASSAAGKLIQIELAQPYSPLIRNIPDELGAVEVIEGQALSARKSWKPAQTAFLKAFQRFAVQGNLNLLRPEAIMAYAEACAKKPLPLCETWSQRIAQAFPRSSNESRALAKHLPESAERAKPAESFSRSTATYRSPDADQAAFDLAMTAFQAEKYKDAIQRFEKLVIDFPKSGLRARTRFWLAKAHELRGDSEKARASHEEVMRDAPLTYYGLISSMARGKPIEEFLSAKSPLARATDPLMTPLETIRLDRAERFLAERGPELAATELREIRSRDALSSPFLTYLASLHSESGSHLGAFLILGELILRGHEGIEGSYGLRTIFPRSHLTLIRDTARELKLDPILVLSLTKQESAFDTRANSPVGAAGLMQLMHATALDMDGGLSRADLLDPAINVRVGAKYLRRMLDRFDGNAVFALAAYNAGPGAVDRWIRENGRDKGILDFIEKIPFKETREYVSSIIRNYYWYASRLGVGPFRGLDAFWVEPPKS